MLQFSEKFFQGECREGFWIEEKMKRAWAAQMEVLMEVDRICKKHGIQYFADSGTLLGAVRHKGFIPWDDDIDIAMTRDEYMKFFAIAQRELPKGWILRDWSNGGGAPYGRMINSTILTDCEERMIHFHGCPYIVGIDIFQLDYVPIVKEEEEAWHLLLRYLSSLLAKLEENGKNKLSDEVEQSVHQAEEWCHIKFDKNKDLNIQIKKIMDQLAQCYLSDEATELEMVVWDWAKERRYKYKREWYSKSIEVPFENIMMPIPIGYEEVLRVLYGEDYMTPIKGTADHEYPFYKRQDLELQQLKNTM